MYRHHVVLAVLLLMTQLCFNQDIKHGECHAEPKDLLSVNEEPVSVLKLLKEENHSEDKEHLSLSSTLLPSEKDSNGENSEKSEVSVVIKTGDQLGNVKDITSKSSVSSREIKVLVEEKVLDVNSQFINSKIKDNPTPELKEEAIRSVKKVEETKVIKKESEEKSGLNLSVNQNKENERIDSHEVSDNNNKAEKKSLKKEVNEAVKNNGEGNPSVAQKFVSVPANSAATETVKVSTQKIVTNAKIETKISDHNSRDVVKSREILTPTVVKKETVTQFKVNSPPKKSPLTEQQVNSNKVSASQNTELKRERRDVTKVTQVIEKSKSEKPETKSSAVEIKSNGKTNENGNPKLTDPKNIVQNKQVNDKMVFSSEQRLKVSLPQNNKVKSNTIPVTEKSKINNSVEIEKLLKEDNVNPSKVTNQVNKGDNRRSSENQKSTIAPPPNSAVNSEKVTSNSQNNVVKSSNQQKASNGNVKNTNVDKTKISSTKESSNNIQIVTSSPSHGTFEISSPSRNSDTVAKREIKSNNVATNSPTKPPIVSSTNNEQKRPAITKPTSIKKSSDIKNTDIHNMKTPQQSTSKPNPSPDSNQRLKRSVSEPVPQSHLKMPSVVTEIEVKTNRATPTSTTSSTSSSNSNEGISSSKLTTVSTIVLPDSSTNPVPTSPMFTEKQNSLQNIEVKNSGKSSSNIPVSQQLKPTAQEDTVSTKKDQVSTENQLKEEVCEGKRSINDQPSSRDGFIRNDKVDSPIIHELEKKSDITNLEMAVESPEPCEVTTSSNSNLSVIHLEKENSKIEIPKVNKNETTVPQKFSATQIEIPPETKSVNENGKEIKSTHVEITAQALQMEHPPETYTQSNKAVTKITTDTQEIGNQKEKVGTPQINANSGQPEQITVVDIPPSLNVPATSLQRLQEKDSSAVNNKNEEEIDAKNIITSENLDTKNELNVPSSSSTLDSGNLSVTLPTWAELGSTGQAESHIQSNTGIKEEESQQITNSDKSPSEDEKPKAEALEQDFTDMDSDGFIPAWKMKRGRGNKADDNSIKSPSLEFPPVPDGETFRIHELGLSEGMFVFSYLGSFLSWMQPYDFPVELLRDALWNRLSIVSLITQSLQVEMGFIACLCIGVLLALAAPLFLMIHACCSLVRRNPSSNNWEDDSSSSADNQGNCRRRTLVFLLQTILLLLVAGIVAMFVTNEQLSSAVNQTPNVVHTALTDVTTFLRNSNLQLHFVVTKSLDQAVEAASNDLDNIETLLGRPIQRELEEETGVDVALNSLVDATAAAQALSNKVDSLYEYCGETRGLALVAQERLADLRHQVDMLRRQCPAKDRALCETVEGSGLDVILHLDLLLTDQRLAGLRRLSQTNLTQVTQQAKGEFQFIPMHVEKETREARSGVRRQLMRQRSLLDDAVWSIEAVTRDLGVRVDSARDKALQIVRGTSDMEQWRYLTGIGAAVAVLLIWILLVAAVSCGCCGAEDKAGPTLLATVGVLCPLYIALWALAMVALLVGGHGEVFVCRPLYDEPRYGALTKLMDKPGVLFQRGGGFFSSLLYGNDSLNVPLKDVLMACQNNEPSYPSFRLHQVFDVDSASNHHNWETLHRQLAKLEVNLTDLQLLTPDLQAQLQELLNAATVNLTIHRTQLSGPVTGKDLLSFSDQLESVSNQITDLATASRMETLATRTRRLLASHIAPLAQRKEDMVYQLTALEVQLLPLQRQVNQSLSHLKTIQFFINNQGANISHTKSQEYINRIVGYLQQYRDHVLHATANSVAPCRPIWDLFHAMRVLFCRHVMDPLNGFWFATVWCLLLLLAAIPLCIKLAACYRQARPGSLLPRSQSEDGANIWK